MRTTNRSWRIPKELAANANRPLSRYANREAGFRITARAAQPDSRWSHRASEGSTIHVILSGSVAEEADAGTVLLSRASLAVRPASRSAEEFRAGPSGARVLSVDYDDAALQRLTPCDKALAKRATFKGRSSVELAWRILGELHAPDALTRATIPIFADGIAIGCSRYLLRQQHVEPPKLAAAAMRILDKEFRRPPSLVRLAKRVGCTPEHLARTFRSSYGFTVRGWVESRRVEEGKRRLSSTRDSISNIATELGFCDNAHFARAFPRATSVSPREFRNAAGDINPIQLGSDTP